MRRKYTSATSLQGATLGVLATALVMSYVLYKISDPGSVTPARLETQRFSVAILQGPKQAAQEAPESANETAEQVAPAPKEAPVKVVAAERKTSLPEAVKAAQTSAKTAPAVKPVEVIPPARVSMPGGQLKVEDTPIGTSNFDPFEVKPRQVYIRLLINENGKVIDGRVVKGGGEPMRDAIILKSMASRSYNKDRLLKAADKNGQPVWQFDMVVDYGTNEFLP